MKQLKATKTVQPIGKPVIHRPNTRNTRPETKTTNWSPAKVRRGASQNQLKQQQKTKSPSTPKITKCSKQGATKKQPRTSKSSPGEIFEQRSKLMALQSSEEHDHNRSFIQVDIKSLQKSNNTMTYEVESDNDATQMIIASSDSKVFMIISPDSPPVQIMQDSTENKAIESSQFKSSKSTRRIDKAVKEIQTLQDNTTKHKTHSLYSWTQITINKLSKNNPITYNRNKKN